VAGTRWAVVEDELLAAQIFELALLVEALFMPPPQQLWFFLSGVGWWWWVWE